MLAALSSRENTTSVATRMPEIDNNYQPYLVTTKVYLLGLLVRFTSLYRLPLLLLKSQCQKSMPLLFITCDLSFTHVVYSWP
jgi:hypothetical protein